MESTYPYQVRRGGSRNLLWDQNRIPPQLRQGTRQVGWINAATQQGVGATPTPGIVGDTTVSVPSTSGGDMLSTVLAWLPWILLAGAGYYYWDDIKKEIGL